MKPTKQFVLAAMYCAFLSSILFSMPGIRRTRAVPGQSGAAAGPEISELQKLFQNPPDDSRVMMRWWWFGPAVTKAELEHEMRLMKEGGIGGFEVQPVYPVALDDATTGSKISHTSPMSFSRHFALRLRKHGNLGCAWI